MRGARCFSAGHHSYVWGESTGRVKRNASCFGQEDIEPDQAAGGGKEIENSGSEENEFSACSCNYASPCQPTNELI